VPALFIAQKFIDGQMSASKLTDYSQFIPVLICAMLAGFLSTQLRRKTQRLIRKLED
jgi:hypothetical protein